MSQSPYPTITAGPPRPSLILRPGQIALPPGLERYTIQGNGAVVIEVEAGDTITVRNVEGGQACELLAWDTTGITDPGIFGEKSNSNAAGIKALPPRAMTASRPCAADWRAGRWCSIRQRRCACSAAQHPPVRNRVSLSRATAL